MAIGVSDGTYHESELAYELSNTNSKRPESFGMGMDVGDEVPNTITQPPAKDRPNTQIMQEYKAGVEQKRRQDEIKDDFHNIAPNVFPYEDKTTVKPGEHIMDPEGRWRDVVIAMEPFDPSTGKRTIRPAQVPGEGGGGSVSSVPKAGAPNPHEVEAIKSPAVRYNKTGKIYEDFNHGLAGAQAEEEFPQGFDYYKDLDQGFTTTKGRFVDRHTAGDIADAAEKAGTKQYFRDSQGRQGMGPRNVEFQGKKFKRGLISEDLQSVQDWLTKKYAPVWERIKGNMKSVKDK